MRRIAYLVVSGALLASGAAFGKLPPPTPQEQAVAADKKAQEQAQLEKEKALLEQAQDRVVQRYRKDGGGGRVSAGGATTDQNMPKTTSELPRGVGPKPDRPQSAEAHSAPAK